MCVCVSVCLLDVDMLMILVMGMEGGDGGGTRITIKTCQQSATRALPHRESREGREAGDVPVACVGVCVCVCMCVCLC